MGFMEQDVIYDWDNIFCWVMVFFFYIDEMEIFNYNYCEYLYWVNCVFGESYLEVYLNGFFDILVWCDELLFNELLVEIYFCYFSYDDYLVVGVSWV